MAAFPTHTSKLAQLDGQINAALRTITLLQSLIGANNDDVLNARITSLQDTANSLSESRDFYAAKTSTAGAVTVDILIHNYTHGFSEQAVVFDGWPVLRRERDMAAMAIRLETIMARPDDVLPMDTLAGPVNVNLAQCQGLMYAGSVLLEAVRNAADATRAQHAAQPFTSWDDIRDYFDQHFEENYVPFVSV